MIDGKKILALIPARGGSKGVPRKNVRLIAGKPLIAWTIEAAVSSKYVDRVVVSSDDDEIMAAATAFGADVPFRRADALATDTTSGMDVVRDTLARIQGYDWIVVLQPTSPLRNSHDVDLALEQSGKLGAPACVSVCEASQSPYWMYSMGESSQMSPLINSKPILRRQDAPKVYVLNGAIYCAEISWLNRSNSFMSAETVGYEMPVERSVDIDTEMDFKLAEMMLDA